MHCIILVERFFLDQRMLECGMRWVAVIRKSVKLQKHINVMSEQKIRKINKELQSTKWQDCITQWVLNSNSKPSMPFKRVLERSSKCRLMTNKQHNVSHI